MAFTDITIAQRNSDYTNVTDPSAKLVSLNRDGDAVLEISTATAEFIVQNLSLHAGKPVIISTGSTYFLAGNYTAPKLECSLVRIVEAANVPEKMPA
jgi:hypothetical protein